MSRSIQVLRGLWLSLPILLISSVAIWGASAQTSAQAVPTGRISTQDMSDFTSYPSGINALAAPNVPPLIMLVMSRDEQLFNAAYSDYVDLNGNGVVDPSETTYTDSFTYNGYFDPDICYKYNGTAASSTASTWTKTSSTGDYQAAVKVSVGVHECPSGNSYWSGNFLNWLSMSRLDILRWTFYGGLRSTDQSTKTILERAEIPSDLHAWAKVYSGSDIANLEPFTGTTTFCNVSTGNTGQWSKATSTKSGVESVPVIRAASGNWTDWASTAKLQCQDKRGNTDKYGDDSARPAGSTDYVARVLVCQNKTGVPNESFCASEKSGDLKPEGLLQKYSEGDNNEKHFGLVTGSDKKARGPGQLRRNVGPLENNKPGTACYAGTGKGDGDEFDSDDGTFCYKSASSTPTEGIVMTLDRLQVTGWQSESSGDNANSGDYGDSGNGCYGPSHTWGARGYQLLSNPSMCPDFGNPLASMYATALNYIQGQQASGQDSGMDALPNPAWVDPYGTPDGASSPRNEPCAACSVVLVSSGLNTFDAPGLESPAVTGVDATSLTNTIQSDEGLTGSYLLSVNSADPGSLTQADKNTSDTTFCAPYASAFTLANLVGICNGAPGQQGGYLLAGLSYGAWSIVPFRTDGKVDKDFRIATYGVSLSDNLPSFSIPVGDSGQSFSISPSCRADPASSSNYTTCYIGKVAVGAQLSYGATSANGYNIYGLVPTTTYPDVGSYYFVWEDSQYGSDHDDDANNVISYCVGDSCNMPSKVSEKSGAVAICDPVVMSNSTNTYSYSGKAVLGSACNTDGTLKQTPDKNTIIIRNQLVSYSSSSMYIGFQISGTTADQLYEFKFTNDGNSKNPTGLDQNGAVFNCNLLGNVQCYSLPDVESFELSGGKSVSPLQSPLWYATKYSDYKGDAPSLPVGQDPPNYFFARNAGTLKSDLDTVFQSITSSAANNFGNATTPSSSNDVQGNGLSYQVQYFMQRNGVNWTGDIQAFWSDSSGFQREGSADTDGNEVLSSSADYIVSGPDTTAGALSGALASYRCSVAPVPPDGATTFDPSTNGNCSIVQASNPLKPAWDAATLLDAYYDPSTQDGQTAIQNIAKQRDYGSEGDPGQRYIFTYLPSTPDGASGTGTITDGTQTDFVWDDDSCSSGSYAASATSGFCGGYDTDGYRTGNFGLLNEKSPALAEELVNWVRGMEYPADYRSRTVTLSGVSATYRLGDIVDSSPMIVGTPSESYDLLYGDYSYAAFRANYANRRQMVYVGANDGMLHAFNGGFYVPGQPASGGNDAVDPTDYRQLPSSVTTGDGSAQNSDGSVPQGNDWALGQEVWAFIPDNLLPHLRWLADKDYTHVFYVDGSPVVSDVQLWGDGSSTTCQSGTPAAADFTTDNGQRHVCGWGTVMVVPFRLGGGNIQVDTVGKGDASDTQTSNSAYVILDITDPEQPPTVLGEITTGTFTTAAPAFAVHRESDGKLHFLLTLGSGPADNGGPKSATDLTDNKPVSAPNGDLGVWVYDLAKVVGGSSTPEASLTNGPAGSFASDMVASDFNLNDSAEGVYFGVVTNPPPPSTTGTPVPQVYGGGLWKVDMNTGPATNADGSSNPPDTSDPGTWKLTQVIKTGQPVTIRPTLALDSTNRPMVYFGTGRSYTTDDDSGTSDQGTQQQYIYGVSDNSLLTNMSAACQVMPTTDNLFPASAANVDSSGNVTDSGLTDVTTLSSLQNALTATGTTGCYTYSGWYLKLTAGDAAAKTQQPSERVVSSQTLFNSILLTPTYTPANLAMKTAANDSDCNPVPVPGTSNLYGLNYLTGTADPSTASSFGIVSGHVARSVLLGSGKASSPVLHTGNGVISAAFGIGGGTVFQKITPLGSASNGEISWREPVGVQ